MNSPNNKHITSVESMSIPKLDFPLSYPTLETNLQENSCKNSCSHTKKNIARENEVSVGNILQGSEALRSPKLVRKINQALNDDYYIEQNKIHDTNILGSIDHSEIKTSNTIEIVKTIETQTPMAESKKDQYETIGIEIQEVYPPEKKEDKKSKGFLRFKMPNVFSKKTKQGEIENDQVIKETAQSIEGENDNVKLLMYKRLNSIDSNNIIQNMDNLPIYVYNELIDNKSSEENVDNEKIQEKEENHTILTNINDKVAKIIEKNKIKHSNEEIIQPFHSKIDKDVPQSDVLNITDVQIVTSEPIIIKDYQRIVRRTIIIDGIEIVIEEIINNSGESIKKSYEKNYKGWKRNN